jgi:hypothetical protein
MIVAYLELIYLLIKGALLSASYAGLLVFLVYAFVRLRKHLHVLTNKYLVKLWMRSAFLIFISLFAYRFSYWQDSGLGETAQVPIGHEQVIYNADGAMTYFDSDQNEDDFSQNDHIHIEKYVVDDSVICAEIANVSHDSDYRYLVYNMQTRELIRFIDNTEYDAYALEQQLPSSTRFYNFDVHYIQYYQKKPKWKRWLLL